MTWRSSTACFLMQFSFCKLAANELMKRELVRRDGRSVADLTVPERMLSGACAGLCYWGSTFPLDAVKVTEQNSVEVDSVLIITTFLVDYD